MRVKSLIDLKHNSTNLLIVDALAKYSPRNIYKIAKELGLPESTVRYRIKMMREKGILWLFTNIYHTNIGLKKGVVFAEINPKYWNPIYKFIDANGFWAYMIRLHGGREIVHTLYTIPVEHISKLNDFLDEMVNLDILRDYRIYYSTCFHRVNASESWYDFKNDKWNFSWKSILDDIDKVTTSLPITLKDPKNFPILADKTDIMILKSLERDATITYTKLAKELNTTPQNIRYHFKHHIEKNFLIEDYEILFLRFPLDTSFIIYFILDFPNYTSMAKTANVFRNKPFTEILGKVLGKHSMLMGTYIPMKEFRNLISILNDMVSIGYLKNFEYFLTPATEYSRRQTIPYIRFKDDYWEYPHDEMIEELYRRFRSINKMIGN